MALIAVRCPHCGGNVDLEEHLASGTCAFCGSIVVNEHIAANVAQSVADRADSVSSMLRLAKHHLEDGETVQAAGLLKNAMMLDPANSDCWYMDAVIDPKNRESDIRRAEEYPSLGIFTRQDLDRFNGVKRSTNGMLIYMLSLMFIFMFDGAAIPLAFFIGIQPLLYVAIVLTVVVIVFDIIHWRMSTRPVRN